MKKILFFVLVCAMTIACTGNSTVTETTTDDTVVVDSIDSLMIDTISLDSIL